MGSTAEDRHKGRGRKSQAGGRSPRAGPWGQSQADARGCPMRGRRPLAPAPCPSLVLARNRGGKESRKKSPQGRGFQSNKCPRRLPKRLLVRGRKAKHGEAASWPSLFQPLPHRTHSATRRSSAPVPSPAAPSSQHCREAATTSRSQPTLAARKQLGWPRPHPRAAPSGDDTRDCKGIPAHPWTEAAQ